VVVKGKQTVPIAAGKLRQKVVHQKRLHVQAVARHAVDQQVLLKSVPVANQVNKGDGARMINFRGGYWICCHLPYEGLNVAGIEQRKEDPEDQQVSQTLHSCNDRLHKHRAWLPCVVSLGCSLQFCSFAVCNFAFCSLQFAVQLCKLVIFGLR
jgi:hypothetical protein